MIGRQCPKTVFSSIYWFFCECGDGSLVLFIPTGTHYPHKEHSFAAKRLFFCSFSRLFYKNVCVFFTVILRFFLRLLIISRLHLGNINFYARFENNTQFEKVLGKRGTNLSIELSISLRQ